MDSKKITVQCWIHGDDVENSFPVVAPRDGTVGALKELIKDKASELKNVAAKNLDLYAIPNAVLEDTLKSWDPTGKNRLNARQKLSNCLTLRDGQEPFIVVEGPMTLNCWVRGQPPHTAFPVQIFSTQVVAELKEVIRNKKQQDFGAVDANRLALYKISEPFHDKIGETLESFDLPQEDLLQPFKTLSCYFPKDLPQEHIHVVVEAPPSLQHRARPPSSIPLSLHNVEAQRLMFLRNRKTEGPSSGGKFSTFANHQATLSKAIHCNRPPDACGIIPPTLLHRTLGEFLDDCETHDSTLEDHSLTEKLRTAMSNTYDVESVRARTLRNVLTEGRLYFNCTLIGDQEYETDGDMSVGPHCYAIAEVKNEVGSTGAEPYYQASLYYLESTRDQAVTLASSPLPCILILLFGPYIAFAGATWNTRPVVEPLSVVLPMHFHHFNSSMRKTVARHLGAFKKAVDALKKCYEDLMSLPRPIPPSTRSQLFPYPTDFTSLCDGRRRRFKYVAQEFGRLIFSGTLEEDEKPVYIKFVRQYSKDAHLACASLGCAPILHGFETISGGWFMVIMDHLIEEEYVRFDSYTEFYDHAPTAVLVHNIANTLGRLHKQHYAHGDVRDTNIMVSKIDKTKFKIVDFDWAGILGEVRYPMNVNRTENLWRPADAVDGALITPEHDMDMLDDIKRRYRVGG